VQQTAATVPASAKLEAIARYGVNKNASINIVASDSWLLCQRPAEVLRSNIFG
jgi:hypothetical protein